VIWAGTASNEPSTAPGDTKAVVAGVAVGSAVDTGRAAGGSTEVARGATGPAVGAGVLVVGTDRTVNFTGVVGGGVLGTGSGVTLAAGEGPGL
jgi:hypothetical protein